MAKGQSRLSGRNASNGQFTTVNRARAYSSTHTVEHLPKRGLGAESSSPRGRDARTGLFMLVKDARHRATAVVEQVPHRSRRG
jgi:hypothetical protein